MNPEDYLNAIEGKKKEIVVGVVGSRRRTSYQDILKLEAYFLSLMQKAKKADAQLRFVSGGCATGADFFIKNLCIVHKVPLIEHLPNFLGRGNSYYDKVTAYYARNKLIAEDSQFLIAMVAEDRKGGTENTIMHCKKLEKKVILI